MALNEQEGLGSIKKSCAHLVLFSFGFLAGYVSRDFVYWHWGQRCSSVLFWMQQATSGPSPFQASASVQALRTALALQPELPASLELIYPEPPELAMGPPPKKLREFCDVVQKAAVKGQVLLLVGDKSVFSPPSNRGTLMFVMMTTLVRFGINNTLLVAHDPPAYRNALEWIKYMNEKGIRLQAVEHDTDMRFWRGSTHPEEKQRSKKWPVLRDVLQCSVHVLFSEFDVLFWDNPFRYIVGDAEVESMSNGWSYEHIFGSEQMLEDPKWLHPWKWRTEFLNSGFFYVRCSNRTVNAMNSIFWMLASMNILDPAAFNAQIRAPLGTPPGRRLHGQALRIRIMDISLFPNSRYFHQLVDPQHASSSFDPHDGARPPKFKWPSDLGRPVAMRVNHHHEKIKMMAYARRAFPMKQEKRSKGSS